MEKEFVTYNQSIRLKELGFDEPCFGWYKLPNKRLCGEYEMVTFQNNYPHIKFVDVPTFSQAFRWFREKYGLHCGINTHTSSTNQVTYVIDLEFGKKLTYEEAELACLDKLIEIVESKEK